MKRGQIAANIFVDSTRRAQLWEGCSNVAFLTVRHFYFCKRKVMSGEEEDFRTW